MIDSQLFLMNVADRKVTPLTRTFNPSVRSVQWNLSDGQIYFTAENRDCYSLYRLDPSSGKIALLDVPEEMVLAFSLADKAPVMAFYGESAANSHRIYPMNLKSRRRSCGRI